MPKYNADTQKQLSEPIEVTLEGKTYIIEKVTTETLRNIRKIGNDKSDDVLVNQLAMLTGADPKEFAGVDLRKISQVLAFITETITSGIAQPKNSQGPATP